ncbi:hypothetical protein SK128_012948, partial [Halocaridina rubra]
MSALMLHCVPQSNIFFWFLPLEVATADQSSPYRPVSRVLRLHTTHRHILPQNIHMSPLWSTSSHPARQYHTMYL